MTSLLTDLLDRLPDLMLRDEIRLGRRLQAARKNPHRLTQLSTDIAQAEARMATRTASTPTISYPAELPISQARDDIRAAIAAHQVVVVAGETGSGKTTQLPKICLELGRGRRGSIGHTQPRRLAARTVAARIAEEMHTELGDTVGWKVRFTDQVGPGTLVKLMTDGILLAEIAHDPMLWQYDTLIIDEAHERSLNIDFILGYLRQLLPRRPDLKVIITSATIDPVRFAEHFGDAPVLEVSGRTFPVEVRYRPVVDPDAEDRDRDQTQAILEAVDELGGQGQGDILVFLSGEREIRDVAEALRGRDLPRTEIVPLYARLSTAEQHKVFEPHALRRVVLATNVAETSLTVPGIRYVIDPGTARISRYSHRTKVQRLPIEAISQASANQRKGRCGRTSDGICIRLYTEEDFDGRPEFTDPEILRTNLASVILQMTSLGLGDIESFGFLDPPDKRMIADGVQLLDELGAFNAQATDPRKRLTPLGRQLASIPIDPRIARMIVEGDRNGCLDEVLIIAAALTIADPRERPIDKQQAADESHSRFADTESDFIGYLNLWRYLHEQRQELSSNRFRAMCKAEFLHYLRIREWQDLVGQLTGIVRGLGMRPSSTEDGRRIHASLLAGLLSRVGVREGKAEFLGARSAKFTLWPGSALARRPPRWVMAAELVETSRLWGRTAARIDPDTVEKLAGHLVMRIYSEPHWDAERGAVMAAEKVTLYGVPLVAARQVNYGSIDPPVARELFIRHALVEGDWRTHHAFLAHNRALLEDVAELEDRARRRDLRIDDETMFELYDQRVSAEVVSARHFDSWWKQTRRTRPDLLTFDVSMVTAAAAGIDEDDYPDTWTQGGLQLPLSYAFEPGSEADGVTVHVPLTALNQLRAEDFSWQVPGNREELVTALLRGLPKPLRRELAPIADRVRQVLPRLVPGPEPLLDALTRELHAVSGVVVPPTAWQLDRLPGHLRTTFRIVDEQDRSLAEGKDLGQLSATVAPQLSATLAASAADLERSGLRTWTVGTIPRTHEVQRAGHVLTAYPALIDTGDSVALRVVDSPAEQSAAMWTGVRRLLILNVASPIRDIVRSLPADATLALRFNPHGSVATLMADCVDAAANELIAAAGGPPWDAAGFTALLGPAKLRLAELTRDIVTRVRPVLAAHRKVESRLSAQLPPAVHADIRGQLDGLVYAGFVAATGRARLPDLVRYLRAVEYRLEKLPGNVERDDIWMAQIAVVRREFEHVRSALSQVDRATVHAMIEDLRVSYFAQALGTPRPVSEKRIFRAMDDMMNALRSVSRGQ